MISTHSTPDIPIYCSFTCSLAHILVQTHTHAHANVHYISPYSNLPIHVHHFRFSSLRNVKKTHVPFFAHTRSLDNRLMLLGSRERSPQPYSTLCSTRRVPRGASSSEHGVTAHPLSHQDSKSSFWPSNGGKTTTRSSARALEVTGTSSVPFESSIAPRNRLNAPSPHPPFASWAKRTLFKRATPSITIIYICLGTHLPATPQHNTIHTNKYSGNHVHWMSDQMRKSNAIGATSSGGAFFAETK